MFAGNTEEEQIEAARVIFNELAPRSVFIVCFSQIEMFSVIAYHVKQRFLSTYCHFQPTGKSEVDVLKVEFVVVGDMFLTSSCYSNVELSISDLAIYN